MAYATIEDVEAGYRELNTDEQNMCAQLLDESALIIDAYNADAKTDNKNLVSCRMVRRALAAAEDGMNVPMGATQGSMSALGYSQSWTMSNGSVGELYMEKLEKKLLGVGNRIGSHSPLQDMV